MKIPPQWLPPETIVSLMGSTGILLTIYALPFGIAMGWTEYNQRFIEHSTALVIGAVMTALFFVLGQISYRLCMFFSKQYYELRLEQVRSIAKEIIDLLVQERYEAVVQGCKQCHLTVEMLRSIMHGYSKEPVQLKAGTYENMETARVTGIRVPTWSVKTFLWTENDRKVDLTLTLKIAIGTDQPVMELIDLHPS